MTEVAHALGRSPGREETKSGLCTMGERREMPVMFTDLLGFPYISSSAPHSTLMGLVLLSSPFYRWGSVTCLRSRRRQVVETQTRVPWGRVDLLPTGLATCRGRARGSTAVSPGPRSPGVVRGQLVTAFLGTWRAPRALHHSWDEGVKCSGGVSRVWQGSEKPAYLLNTFQSHWQVYLGNRCTVHRRCI